MQDYCTQFSRPFLQDFAQYIIENEDIELLIKVTSSTGLPAGRRREVFQTRTKPGESYIGTLEFNSFFMLLLWEHHDDECISVNVSVINTKIRP
jgi:hypothetical protein